VILKQRNKKLSNIKNQAIGGLGSNPMSVPTRQLQTNGIYSTDPLIQEKEKDLQESRSKAQFYKEEIERMRHQLEQSYNIQKITELEDE
jgi:hypothetical protein